MLQTTFCNISFSNPLVLASGILGVTAASMKRMVDLGAGGVTIKSLSETPREGHHNPTMIQTHTYVLNAVGLSNPGMAEGSKEIGAYKRMAVAPIIGSIFAGDVAGFVRAAEAISQTPIDILELDVSCPNVGHEFGEPFAYSAQAIQKITAQVKAVATVPLSIKLSPNAWNIATLAKAAEDAGADAITAVNTAGGMAINIEARRPILHNRHGGVSGPVLFPIALKCVYDIYEAVQIPIIGTGGITTGKDAIEMIMAGATLLGIGSAIAYRGDGVFQEIQNEMTDIMEAEGIASLDEIRGAAHHI